MTTNIPPLVLGIGGVIGLVLLVLLWRALIAAAVIGGSQWAVITHFDSNHVAVLIAVAVPALLAGIALASAMPTRTRSARGRSRKVKH